MNHPSLQRGEAVPSPGTWFEMNVGTNGSCEEEGTGSSRRPACCGAAASQEKAVAWPLTAPRVALPGWPPRSGSGPSLSFPWLSVARDVRCPGSSTSAGKLAASVLGAERPLAWARQRSKGLPAPPHCTHGAPGGSSTLERDGQVGSSVKQLLRPHSGQRAEPQTRAHPPRPCSADSRGFRERET